MHIDGGCHCGYIKYEAEVDPNAVRICHCTDCQTLTGSAYRVTVAAPSETFKLTGGNPKIYVKIAESGNHLELLQKRGRYAQFIEKQATV